MLKKKRKTLFNHRNRLRSWRSISKFHKNISMANEYIISPLLDWNLAEPAPKQQNQQTLQQTMQAVKIAKSIMPVVGPVSTFFSALSQIVQMPRDPRYQMSVLAKLGIPVIVAIAVVSYLFWNYMLAIPILAAMIERIILIILAIAGYFILHRELERYRAVISYCEQNGLTADRFINRN